MPPEEGSRGPNPKATIADYREALRTADEPVLTPKEIAEAVGLTKSAVNYRKDELINDDEIRSKEVGRTRVFWHKNVDLKKEWSSSFDHVLEVDDPDFEEDGKLGIEFIDDFDVDGEGEIEKLRRGAIHIVFKQLTGGEDLTSSHLKRLIDSYPFNETYDSEDGLWNTCIHPALNECEGLEYYGDPEHRRWLWEDNQRRDLIKSQL